MVWNKKQDDRERRQVVRTRTQASRRESWAHVGPLG